jgi:hypothetical protein
VIRGKRSREVERGKGKSDRGRVTGKEHEMAKRQRRWERGIRTESY